jgi:hypothetical protein
MSTNKPCWDVLRRCVQEMCWVVSETFRLSIRPLLHPWDPSRPWCWTWEFQFQSLYALTSLLTLPSTLNIHYTYIRRPRPWQGGARQAREVVKQLTINNEQPIAAAAAAGNFWRRNWMVLCCFASMRKKLESLNHNFIGDEKGHFCVSVATFWARNLVVFCCCGCVWKSWKVSVLFSSSKVSEGTLGTFLGFLCYVLGTKLDGVLLLQMRYKAMHSLCLATSLAARCGKHA